ncbi:MAG: PstS family phosphate ABC transporter substrate-binding protein [Aggregatilineales bacterium]
MRNRFYLFFALLLLIVPLTVFAQDSTMEAEMEEVEPIELPEVDPLSVTGDIVIAGSSTVFPVTERMADLFVQDGFPGTITVDSIGSGAGFSRFCAGETDISNASRPIRDSERETCLSIGRDPIELYIGIDALAVVVSTENDFVFDLSKEELALVFAGGTGTTWQDIRPEWPAEPIRLFAPGTDSGTFDFFVEEIFDRDPAPILNAPGIQLSEDDNVLVQGVVASPFAIGFFGYAYYAENTDTLRAIAIDGVEPTEEAAETGEYPLSRPLFLYTAAPILAEKPQVAAFLLYYLTFVNDQLGTEEGQIGYFPVSVEAMNTTKTLLLEAIEEAGLEF